MNRRGMVAGAALVLLLVALPWVFRPVIVVQPNPVPDGPGLGRAVVTWRAITWPRPEVVVSMAGGPPTRLSAGWVGSVPVEWIQAGVPYEFGLRRGTGQPFVSVVVTRNLSRSNGVNLTALVGVLLISAGSATIRALLREARASHG